MTVKAVATPSISIGSKALSFSRAAAWLRYVSWGRLSLAVAAFLFSFLFPPSSPTIYRILTGAFIVYMFLVALRTRGMKGLAGWAALFGDAMFFVVIAVFGSERFIWMPAVFFLHLLVEALMFFTSVEAVVVTGLCAAACFLLPFDSLRRLQPTVLVAGSLACGFAFSQQRQRRQLALLTDKLEEAREAADKAGESERQRIASDFHDGPLQSFISLQMRLEILRKLLERDTQAGMEDLRQLQTLAQNQIRDLRAFLHSMRPVDVDGANLVATARRAVETFQKETGIPVTFQGATTPVGLPREMSLEVLQMLKESLHNIQKHAGATRVAVSMEKAGRSLEISIDDNGHGFPFAGTYTLEELELLRLGPASLKRRARSLNAELLLESRPGRGAGLKFRIPLQ